MRSKTVVRTGIAAVLGISLTLALSLTGSADAGTVDTKVRPCPYPAVCLYRGDVFGKFGAPTAKFRDVTSYFQPVTRSQKSIFWVNSRHDDVVYLRLSSGRPICVRPRGTGNLTPGEGVRITGIRISYASRC